MFMNIYFTPNFVNNTTGFIVFTTNLQIYW